MEPNFRYHSSAKTIGALEYQIVVYQVEIFAMPNPIQIGDFRIERQIGVGGMGNVYLARQESLDRLVAMKILGAVIDAHPRTKRGRAMKARVMALFVDGQPGPRRFSDEPILRYSDPTRGITDASVWRLGQTGRPRAILVLEVDSGRSIQIEPTAVVDPPKQVTGSNWQWSPASPSFKWISIPVDIDTIVESVKLQRIAKQLSRRFSADETFRGQTYQLRRMPQRLLQYVDADKGEEAGAMFAWTHGTNVEALMFIEVQVGKDGKLSWVAMNRSGAFW